jgi:hypothetical protein
MAKPQGLTAEAIPAAKAKRDVAPTKPPRKLPDLPDSLSTNKFTKSMSVPLPIVREAIAATRIEAAATMTAIM